MIEVAATIAFLDRVLPGCEISHRERYDEYFNRRTFVVKQRGEDSLAFAEAAKFSGVLFGSGLIVDFTINVFRVEMTKAFGDIEILLHCRERDSI